MMVRQLFGRPTILLICAGLLLFGCQDDRPESDRPESDRPESEGAGELESAPGKTAETTSAVASDVEATSLLGQELPRPVLDPAFATEQEGLLAQARVDLEADPEDPLHWIWVGRRTAYLGRYREAIDIYSRALERHPEEPRLYRHRGHRFITVRQFDEAIEDLERAAELLSDRAPEVEPDGLPNALGRPTGTTHSSTWYHLGLAHYLQGDYAKARGIYEECLSYSGNPDMLVATSYWLYWTLLHLGEDGEAARLLEPIEEGLELIENEDYFRLLRLARTGEGVEALQTGSGDLSAATVAYGVGSWYLHRGEEDQALDIYRQLLEAPSWSAFGYLAAEAEIARRSQPSG